MSASGQKPIFEYLDVINLHFWDNLCNVGREGLERYLTISDVMAKDFETVRKKAKAAKSNFKRIKQEHEVS